MSISVEEFLQTANKRKKSKLDVYKDAIIKLKQAGVTNKEILRFLHMNNVSTSPSNLHHFIKKLSISGKTGNATIQKLSASELTDNQIADFSIKTTANINNDEISKRPSWASQKPMRELI